MSISPYRFKQLIAFQKEHYALVEAPDYDLLYQISEFSNRWKLEFRVQEMVISGSSIVLLPSQTFCKKYQLFSDGQLSPSKSMDKSFLLGDGYIIQRSSVGGDYVISDKPIEYVREFGLDDHSATVLPSTIKLFEVVMLRDDIILASTACGIWETSLKAYRKVGCRDWEEILFPSSLSCKNHYIRWLDDGHVLVASDKQGQYQRLFSWNVLSNSVKPVDSISRDQFLFMDSQFMVSNHHGHCEVVTSDATYKTGYCRDFCRSDNRLTLMADYPATSQRLWTIDLSESSKTESKICEDPKSLTVNGSGELVISEKYAFSFTEEKLEKGSMLRFTPTTQALGTVVFVHGGPGLCEGSRMRENIVELVNNGFEVISFDATGSAGFGRMFRNRLNRKHGSLDLFELELILRRKINHFPIFLYGESYGGYLVLKAGIEYPHLIEGIINYYGVTDWWDAMLDFENLSGPLKSRMYKNFGNPNTDKGRVYLKNISILPEADKLTLPIFTIHGSEDKSVPLSHSQKLYKTMLKAHSLSRLLVMHGEGHEIRQYTNRKKAIEEVLSFLKQCLNCNN